MKFVKMHGCGNDYIFVEEKDIGGWNRSELAKIVSDRKKGIGSDGLIILCNSDSADLRMEMYNADGSRGQMCGNGIRCLCKYAFERKHTIKKRLRVETDSGIRLVCLAFSGKKVIGAKVDMGTPLVEKRHIYNPEYEIIYVDVGNPHAILFVDDVNKTDVDKIGKILEYHSAFPDRVNVEFVQIINDMNINMRVWERGSGETLACGTGACASVIAGFVTGRCNNEAHVQMKGGTLKVQYNDTENKVYLFGDANEVYSGEFPDNRIGW